MTQIWTFSVTGSTSIIFMANLAPSQLEIVSNIVSNILIKNVSVYYKDPLPAFYIIGWSFVVLIVGWGLKLEGIFYILPDAPLYWGCDYKYLICLYILEITANYGLSVDWWYIYIYVIYGHDNILKITWKGCFKTVVCNHLEAALSIKHK